MCPGRVSIVERSANISAYRRGLLDGLLIGRDRREVDNSGMDLCPRCGSGVVGALPCGACWEGKADSDFVRSLVGFATGERGQQASAALRLLAAVDDRRAAAGLRGAILHEDPNVRVGALRSLGWSGEQADVARVIPLLADPEPAVRAAARAALADLGGPKATEALFASRDGLSELERGDAQAALAWLGDRRDLESIRAHAIARLRGPDHVSSGMQHYGAGAIYALIRVGSAADRRLLADVVLGMIEQAEIHDPSQPYRSPDVSRAYRAGIEVEIQLKLAGHEDEASALRIARAERLGERLPAENRRPVPREVPCEPAVPRSVKRLTMRSLNRELPASAGGPPAKFGGHPDWLETPCWPLGPHGAPMIFYGQLPVDREPSRTAYIFIAIDATESWRPLDVGNAVVVQPGPPPEVATTPIATGPMLFTPVPQPNRYRPAAIHEPYQRFIELEPGADPAEWRWPELPDCNYPRGDDGDWRKIGGTPYFLQGDDWPPGDGWRFAFQFSAGWAGHELADGAECYGFINNDGRGAFLWQCH